MDVRRTCTNGNACEYSRLLHDGGTVERCTPRRAQKPLLLTLAVPPSPPTATAAPTTAQPPQPLSYAAELVSAVLGAMEEADRAGLPVAGACVGGTVP